MNGNKKVVLDTNVIIFASKQKLDMQKLLERYDDFYVSIITYIEVYGYPFENAQEKELIDELFGALQVIEVNQIIANQTINYRQNKIRKIKLPDAIILATTRYAEAELLTDDWDDFKDIDNQVVVKNIDDLKM